MLLTIIMWRVRVIYEGGWGGEREGGRGRGGMNGGVGGGKVFASSVKFFI